MQEKQKVTLYLPHELHRQLKVRAAVDSATMTDLAQKAIEFYLANAELVESSETVHGHAHRVYSCPDCSSSVVVRDGSLHSLSNRLSAHIQGDVEELSLSVVGVGAVTANAQGEDSLVPC